MNLTGRVKRLMRHAPEFARRGARARQERQRQTAEQAWRWRAEEILARFDQLLLDADPHVPEAEYSRLQAAIAYIGEHGADYPGSVGTWVKGLCAGQSRLPPDLSAETMCKLVLVRLLERENVGDYEEVCEGCGLQRPHRRFQRAGVWSQEPDFFPHCPHCGSKARMWAHRILEKRYPWMDLPGYVGRRGAAGTSATDEAS
jgi:hypothetical protein